MTGADLRPRAAAERQSRAGDAAACITRTSRLESCEVHQTLHRVPSGGVAPSRSLWLANVIARVRTIVNTGPRVAEHLFFSLICVTLRNRLLNLLHTLLRTSKWASPMSPYLTFMDERGEVSGALMKLELMIGGLDIQARHQLRTLQPVQHLLHVGD